MIVLYLKLVALSLVAVALAACGRLGVAGVDQFRSPPRFGEPPSEDSPPTVEPPETLDTLQARLDALDAQIINLRKVVEIMNPPVRAEDFMIAANDSDADPRIAPVRFGWSDSCTTFVSPTPACWPVEAMRASR